MRSFTGAFLFAGFALLVAFGLGWNASGSPGAGVTALVTTAILGILELSLSFDNAVVNARILGGMAPFWRTMFLTVGMVIAVFGMRLVFPLLVVWVVSTLPFPDVVAMVWHDPYRFQHLLEAQHGVIAGFGGSFLILVFVKFFFDSTKDIHWVPGVERLFGSLGRFEGVGVLLALAVALGVQGALPAPEAPAYLVASVGGVVAFLLVNGLGSFWENSPRGASGGLGLFLYLEVLDASFSFDGVIGAFAITNNLLVITLGLGIGAFFVRSLTLKMVADQTLGRLRYLEHGAFWAIGALAVVMELGALGVDVPEIVSGSVGMGFILLSFLSSLRPHRPRGPRLPRT